MRFSSIFESTTMLLFALLVAPKAQATISSACEVRDASVSSPTVWVLCAEGTIAVSDDGGATWREQEATSQEKLRAIESLDSRRAFVAGDQGLLLATEDGGKNWKRVPTPTDQNLTAMHFVGESGWLTGWGGVMLHSADGGQTWLQQPTNVSQTLESVYFTDPVHGWAVGWVGVIIRTIDGGDSWQEVRAPAALWSLSSVYFRDPSEGWAVGFLGQILRSHDGGATWELQASPLKGWLATILFDSANRGWIAGDDGVLVSDDAGESWKVATLDENLFLRKLLSLDGSVLAITSDGVLQLTEAGVKLDQPRRVVNFRAGDVGLPSASSSS